MAETKRTGKYRIEITKRHVAFIDFRYRWELKEKVIKRWGNGTTSADWFYVDSGVNFIERGARRAAEKQLKRRKYYPDELVFKEDYDRNRQSEA